MSRLRSKRSAGALLGLVLLFAPYAALLAQSAAEIESSEVKRVGARLACKCGSCQSTIACDMPGGCGYCKRVKTKIAQMQAQGQSDKTIIDQLVNEGERYLPPAGLLGFITPYLALAFGLVVIVWFVRRQVSATAATAPAVEPQVFGRYHDRIEKDLEKLE